MPEIIIENFETIENQILQLCDELGYLSVGEILSRTTAPTIARVDFTALALAHYLDEVDDGQPPLPDFDEVTNEALAPAAALWLRRTIEEHMSGRKRCRYKVSLWRPKGDAQIYSCRCTALRANPEPVEEEEEVSGITPPAPNMPAVPSGVLPPDATAWQALSGAYVHFASLLQNGYAHLFGLQNNAVGVLTGDNQRLRKTLESAYGDLAKLRIGTFEIETEQRQEAGSSKVREELGRQFISELGALGRVVAASQKRNPALPGVVRLRL